MHENQTIEPQNNFYLTGESVVYSCVDNEHILDGNPKRTCNWNGLWTGRTPFCAKGIYARAILNCKYRTNVTYDQSKINFIEHY